VCTQPGTVAATLSTSPPLRAQPSCKGRYEVTLLLVGLESVLDGAFHDHVDDLPPAEYEQVDSGGERARRAPGGRLLNRISDKTA
jgi:hypothetical protein